MNYQPPPQRAGASGVSIAIGLLEMRFDLVPTGRPRKSEDTGLKMTCPADHDHPVRVEQRYICPDNPDHGPFLASETARARLMPDETLAPIDPDKVAEAKAGGKETGRLDISVFPTAQVSSKVLPSGKTFRLRPAKTRTKVSDRDVEMYAVWRDLIDQRSDITLMGRLLLRGTPGLYRLGVWGGQIVLEEIAHPDDLAERDSIEVDVADSTAAKFAQFVDSHVEEWEPGTLSFDVASAIDAVAGQSPEGEAQTYTAASSTLDLDALLDRVMAA